ncbi:unnamed protein product [Kuraishia capsulata CBS 1993]|uniref:Glutamyl-tRNA(Gln) amidotransferase subunit A, mitochondrial n=1 Tax=Kuraishia capsulata CBS 1993 TaxID=1382522 RepID=W6MLD0_9ASCO|nr:uncharacterized protein KUCA_T00003259001 [Kuraishia capsulata CBS 1993]CDK27281.1 unnamed protein product [Kuraishia capsulata CBS 1993]
MSFLSGLKAAQLKYNIFTSIRENVDAELLQALSGKLKKVTVAIKDNIVTKEDKTTCSSQILADYESPFDATVVRLLKEQGAVVVGKTNLDEFGMGSGTTHSHFGPTLNPLYPDEARISGGSSGGSAAAVSAGLVDVALGTDTGGSIRLPASYTGVVGFKPTYSRISRWGVVPYAQSLDTVGLLSRDVSIIRQVFTELDKYDPNDPTSLAGDIRETIPKRTVTSQRLRIGVCEQFNVKELSQPMRNAWISSLERFSKDGHELVPVSIPSIKHALSAYYVLAPAEAASNLSRYDGVRYGFRNYDKSYGTTRSTGFGSEVQKRIMLGNFNLSSEAYSNHFLKAQRVRRLICDEFNEVFKLSNPLDGKTSFNDLGIDLIVTPTSTSKAPTLEKFRLSQNDNGVTEYVDDVMTVPASLAGLPSIVVPWNTDNGVCGIQLTGQFGDDNLVLDVAETFMAREE